MELNIFGRKLVIGFQSPFYDERYDNNLNEGFNKGFNEDFNKEDEGLYEDENRYIDNVYKVNSDLTEGKVYNGDMVEISEKTLVASPKDIQKIIDSDNTSMTNLMNALKLDYSIVEIFKENEEMSKDPIVGSAMELMCDDSCLRNPTNKRVVHVNSQNKGLSDFLNTFLEKTIDIDSRIWEWCFEVVKNGDFKLRRREYSDGKVSGVYYENVLQGYAVSRIEYMGQVVGYFDEEDESSRNTLQPVENFVHFMNTKSLRRNKIKVKVMHKEKKDGMEEQKEIECTKVFGTSLIDNARYIFRIVRLLDDMLIMSRVARSTQFNLVKIEVGNSSPQETDTILNQVRRRFEGATRLTKGKGMRSDPSPIPVNSNIYIPTREGKGDVMVDSINESVDVKFITDIDHFRNKEFATIKTPKAFLGFEEELPGSMGNTNLLKMDLRYARTVQRAQNALREGIRDLCDNYLKFRGREKDMGNYEIIMRDVTGIEDSGLIEDLLQRVGLLDSICRVAEENEDIFDKDKLMVYCLNLIGIDVTEVAKDSFLKNFDKGVKKVVKDDELEDDEEDEEEVKDGVIGG